MNKIDTFKVSVIGWDDYNSKKKKGHACIMLSTRFFDNIKINRLSLGGRQVYLWMLLRCGDAASGTIEGSIKVIVRSLGGASIDVSRIIYQLEELQLVRIENVEFLKNRIEKKRKDIKLKEASPKPKPEKKQVELIPAEAPTKVGQQLVAYYCDLWKLKHHATAPLRPQDCKALKSFGETNGISRTKELLDGYFKIPDTWVIKKRHDIQTFLNNLSAIAAFVESGKVVSNTELRQMDQAIGNMSTLDALRNGDI